MTVRVLEHVVRRTGLAVRLTDLATGRPVTQRITVTAWPPDRPDLAVATDAVTPAGVAGFVVLPGLGRYEDGSTERHDWFTSPLVFSPLPFVVRVVDGTGDHLPVVREVLVPSPRPIEVALPRSPAALTPSGWLTLVASVVTESGDPAAWAVVEATVGGAGGSPTYVTGGVADDQGRAVVPIPRAVAPTAGGTAATGPVWPVEVRVRYRLADQVTAPGAAVDDPPTVTSLFGQQPAQVDDGGLLVGSLVRDLTTAGPLVAASALGARAPSVLVVRPLP